LLRPVRHGAATLHHGDLFSDVFCASVRMSGGADESTDFRCDDHRCGRVAAQPYRATVFNKASFRRSAFRSGRKFGDCQQTGSRDDGFTYRWHTGITEKMASRSGPWMKELSGRRSMMDG